MGKIDLTPKWLKAELFEELLKETVDGYKQIKSFKTAPGTAAGENYATIMLRAEFEIQLLDGSIKEHNFMLKVGHESETSQDFMKSFDLFDVENAMYTNIVPELEQLYRDVDVDVKFGARAYEIPTSVEYVLLENLAPKGFKNVNRLEGLDMEHTECVLRKIAQWHAASAVRVATKGPYPAELTQGFYKPESKEALNRWMNNSAKPLFDCVKSFETHKTYLEQIKKFHQTVIDEVIKLGEVDSNVFNVLNHGDLWSNNIMFQYDDSGKVKETYLVDYQGVKYGTFAQDLYYFLLSSTKVEYKLSKFDYFVKFYHDNLIEHLKLLKYNKPLPKLKDLHATLCRHGLWGSLTTIGVMAAVLVDPTKNANIDNIFSDSVEGEDFRSLMYSNSRYRKHMDILLPWLVNRGAFDV